MPWLPRIALFAATLALSLTMEAQAVQRSPYKDTLLAGWRDSAGVRLRARAPQVDVAPPLLAPGTSLAIKSPLPPRDPSSLCRMPVAKGAERSRGSIPVITHDTSRVERMPVLPSSCGVR